MLARAAALAASLALIPPAGIAAPATIASCDAPAPLQFAPGRSAGEAKGGLPRGELACWTLSAKAGQTMVATISSTSQNAVMQIYAPGWQTAKPDGNFQFTGRALKKAAEGDDAAQWTGTLPASGKFLFVLGTTGGGGDYDLHVSVKAAH